MPSHTFKIELDGVDYTVTLDHSWESAPRANPPPGDVMRTCVFNFDGAEVHRVVRCAIEAEVWHAARAHQPNNEKLLLLYEHVIRERAREILQRPTSTEFLDYVVDMNQYALAEQFFRASSAR